MKFDLENLNPGTWFDDGDGGRICLRLLSPEEVTAIARKSIKKRVEYKHGSRFEYDEINDDLAFDLTFDACITDWEGQVTADGTDLPCTKENKLKLMRKSPAFAAMVKNNIEKLREAETVEKAEAEKN